MRLRVVPGSLRSMGLATLGAVACYGPPDAPRDEPTPAAEPAALLVQAVDAGTGAALSDPELTVRYLVRSPIELDATAVEKVSAIEPYEIRQVIEDEALVVELRLEAESYHRLDTVLSVPRGSTAGPLTMRMSRRLGRVASAQPAPATTPLPSRPVHPAEAEERSRLRPRGPTERHCKPATAPSSAAAGSRRPRPMRVCRFPTIRRAPMGKSTSWRSSAGEWRT